ncbi:MAG: GNAT family N-acetyltransferase [Proteobacteria bacterium]|nr:GNAT family N-acetyltransferase [Pseudomonadota bacterium]
MTIEFAKVSDVTEIGNLSRKYIEHDLGWKYTPEKLIKIIKNRSKNVVVTRKGNKLAGFGIMTYHEEQANLDLLAVKMIYRRRGIGKQIVKWLEEVALNAGIFNIFVQARKINNGAIKFYNKLGFEIIDEKSGYYRGQETGVIMSKNIRQMINAT